MTIEEVYIGMPVWVGPRKGRVTEIESLGEYHNIWVGEELPDGTIDPRWDILYTLKNLVSRNMNNPSVPYRLL